MWSWCSLASASMACSRACPGIESPMSHSRFLPWPGRYGSSTTTVFEAFSRRA
jgi:hypothetical protein